MSHHRNHDLGLAAFADVAILAANKIGGSILNGLVERHMGIKDVEVAETLGMAGTTLAPVVRNAYAAQPDETLMDTIQRRVVWTFGLAGIAVLTVGTGWVLWSYLKKEEDEED